MVKIFIFSIRRFFTEAERKDIRSYQVGDVVRFARECKKLGIAKGAGEKRTHWATRKPSAI